MGLKLVSEDTDRLTGDVEKRVVFRKVWSLSACLQSVGIMLLLMGITVCLFSVFNSSDTLPSDVKNFVLILVGNGLAVGMGVFSYFAFQKQSYLNDLCKRYGFGIDNALNSSHGANVGNLQKEHINVRRPKEEQRVELPHPSGFPENVSVFVVRNKNGITVEELHYKSTMEEV